MRSQRAPRRTEQHPCGDRVCQAKSITACTEKIQPALSMLVLAWAGDVVDHPPWRHAILGGRWSGMRIVGGTASGRRLVAPEGSDTRPTGERVREALFNTLASRIRGSAVLDLYGGSGALSLEALSWGARSAIIVEPRASAQRAIVANARALAMHDRLELWRMSAEDAVRRLAGQGRFGLILCDPPWQAGLSQLVRDALAGLLEPAGVIVLEHPFRSSPPGIAMTKCVRTRKYGRTGLTFYQQGGDPPDQPAGLGNVVDHRG